MQPSSDRWTRYDIPAIHGWKSERVKTTKVDSNLPHSAKHIAVLLHPGDRHRDIACYNVAHLARFWREDGHKVSFVYGTRHRVPADLLFVHVNLTVVPDEYLEFATRYPIVLNGTMRDIRKSTISTNLVGREDDWQGPVIVKSDLNYGGLPERVLQRTWLERRWRFARRLRRAGDRLAGRVYPFGDSSDYKVYDCIRDVEEHWFENPQVVIEKFRPEIEDGQYHSRIYQFLGDRWTCLREVSPNPIVKAENCVRQEDIEPHPDVVAWREKTGMDYGKLDYVINNGEMVLLDVNKTTGAVTNTEEPEKQHRLRRHRAEGLYSYFESV